MKNIIDKLNVLMDKFAIALADSLASMIMFWVITLMVILPLFWSQPVGGVAWMIYIVSVFFQGVALPVLGYTAKLSGKRTDIIIEEIKKLSLKIEQQTEHIEKDVDEIEKDVEHIEKDVDEIIDDIEKPKI